LIRVCIKTSDDLVAARRAASQAADRGLTLVHQCHVQSPFETVSQIERCLQEIDHPNFGLIFEAANLEECQQDYGPATIARLAPWIRNVYLQNQRLSPTGQITLDTWTQGPVSFDIIDIPEPGGIDFQSVFAGLHQIGYDGVVTVHQSAPQPSTNVHDSASKIASYLRAMIVE
jgi:sugar phosphate isomerase/epimerase